MRNLVLWPTVVLLSFCFSILQADTIHVPSQQPTIQAGIDAASEGDTVLVADGIYIGTGNKNLDFVGVNLVVKSENGYEYTIIDCENDGRAFFVHSGEDTTTIIQGFKLINGNVEHGGALYIIDSSFPKIISCYIENNYSSSHGGACYVDNGASIIIRECIFMGNYSGNWGGAIRHAGDILIIDECILDGNSAQATGCISLATNSAVITNTIISNNIGNGWHEGGGLGIAYTNLLLQKTIITGNSASYGGGIWAESGSIIELLNCTISDNHASVSNGGGIEAGTDCSINEIKNCIIWDNLPEEIIYEGGNINIDYTDIKGGWEGEGNIDEDPLFVGGDPYDYHLTEISPCIDAGDPNSPFDPDSTRVDMGAYYYDQTSSMPILSISVEPDTTYTHKGDTLGFTVMLTNNTDSTVFFQGWTEGETPWGEILSPLLGPIGVFLGPQQVISPHISQRVPWITPYGGPYIYIAIVGTYPDSVIAEDSFEFFVVPPGLHPKEQQYEDWEVIEGGLW